MTCMVAFFCLSCSSSGLKCKGAMPRSPENGNMVVLSPTGKKRRVGTNVIFSCDDGYTMEGSPVVKCMKSGNWSGPTPTCLSEFSFMLWYGADLCRPVLFQALAQQVMKRRIR